MHSGSHVFRVVLTYSLLDFVQLVITTSLAKFRVLCVHDLVCALYVSLMSCTHTHTLGYVSVHHAKPGSEATPLARTSDIGCCLEDMKAGVCGTWDVGHWTLSFTSEDIGLHHMGRGTLLQRCGPQGGLWTWDVGRRFRDVDHRGNLGLGTLDVVSTSGPGGPPPPFQKNPTIGFPIVTDVPRLLELRLEAS